MQFSLYKRDYQVKYAFKFLSGNNYIFELKFRDVKEDAPKDERVKWIYLSKTLTPLEFESMDENSRVFKNGFHLNLKDCTLRTGRGDMHMLTKIQPEDMKSLLEIL